MSSSEVAILEGLKGRLEKLERAKIKAETEEAHLKEKLSSLMAQIEKDYGVKSLDELRKLSEEMMRENQDELSAFDKQLADIEGKLNSLSVEG